MNTLRKFRLSRIVKLAVSVFGVLWLIIEPLFLLTDFTLGWDGYCFLIGASILTAIATEIAQLSRRKVSQKLASSDTHIEIKVGDLFEETGNLVIGTNDVFDTELGDLIRRESVQGQFQEKVYRGDREKLDTDVTNALEEIRGKLATSVSEDKDKKIGKKVRYPIGTVVTLSDHNKKYFLLAYAHMDTNGNAKSSGDTLWQSLNHLWTEVRQKGASDPVAISVIGSRLARTDLKRDFLIKLIILSFIASTKQGYISSCLTVIVHHKDFEQVNFYELEQFLKSVCT